MPDPFWKGFDNDGKPIILKCPTCASTELKQVGFVDKMKREKLLQCQNCGTKF